MIKKSFFRVYAGGEKSKQYEHFMYACGEVNRKLGDGSIAVEVLLLRDLKTNGWTLKEFVDWLLTSHIHFIIVHVHQGLETFRWSISDIYFRHIFQISRR
jgi:hypothetical protein